MADNQSRNTPVLQTEIFVGNARKKFVADTDSLCRYSPFIHHSLSLQDLSRPTVLLLLDEEPTTVQRFIYWLECKDFRAGVSNKVDPVSFGTKDENGNITIHPLVDLYAFAYKFQVLRLKDDILTFFYSKASVIKHIDFETCEIVCENLATIDPLTRMLVDWFAVYGTDQSFHCKLFLRPDTRVFAYQIVETCLAMESREKREMAKFESYTQEVSYGIPDHTPRPVDPRASFGVPGRQQRERTTLSSIEQRHRGA